MRGAASQISELPRSERSIVHAEAPTLVEMQGDATSDGYTASASQSKMFTNRHDLVVAKVGVFEQAAHRLVAQIVPAQIGELGPLHDGAERVPNGARRFDR